MASWIYALLGGCLIGVAVSLMLYWNGRVTGISGIVNGLLHFKSGDMAWRGSFVAGLFAGGLTLWGMAPELLQNTVEKGVLLTIAAGLLVGFGTVMGSGCTSGHGVCGVSRMSPRSLVATLSFMTLGFITVFFARHLFGGQ